jgi:hypothetical protein
MRSGSEVLISDCVAFASIGEIAAGGADVRDWNQGQAAPQLPLRFSQTRLADWNATVTKKSRHPDFDEILEILRSHSFDVSTYSGVAGGFLVSKHGAGAVLVAHEEGAAMAITPGALVRGEVARLLDRGYQKFIKTSQYELPASASQLQAIHLFSEELKLLTGAISLYNESLGTTSDRYQYDRLNGREAAQSAAARPWELTGRH